MHRSRPQMRLVALAVAAFSACATQDDVERKPCEDDSGCAAGQRCLETESGLACINVGGDETWERDVAPLLDARCVSCHAPPSYLSGVRTFRLDVYEDVDGVLGAWSMRDRIVARSVTAANELDAVDQDALSDEALSNLLLTVMPPGVPLPVEDRELLQSWVHAGAPRSGP